METPPPCLALRRDSKHASSSTPQDANILQVAVKRTCAAKRRILSKSLGGEGGTTSGFAWALWRW